jgi:hypothetical protein
LNRGRRLVLPSPLVVDVLVRGRFEGSNGVVDVDVVVVVSVPDVVEVSPGLMSVVNGGLVLVIVSVLVVSSVLLPDTLGSRKYWEPGGGSSDPPAT